ncbi:hypothetical protein [Rossellomorea marisflavi]|uniref:hypothetical protein n=1 Tax=Rossellomorea marisflavi TaxID=189381 RepID=UPI00064ED3D2|nr:hypothetical protein [Rossellomorea marisflavi]KMK93732.1 hypothetical protein VL03_12745 [Rossellomorea marisflavi]
METKSSLNSILELRNNDSSIVRKFGSILEKRYNNVDVIASMVNPPVEYSNGEIKKEVDQVFVLLENGFEVVVKKNVQSEYSPNQIQKFDIESSYVPFSKIKSITEDFVKVSNGEVPNRVIIEHFCGRVELVHGKVNGFYSSGDNEKDLNSIIRYLKNKKI